jgi:hypothetical protein
MLLVVFTKPLCITIPVGIVHACGLNPRSFCALLASFNLKYLLVFVGLLISTDIVLMQIKEIS